MSSDDCVRPCNHRYSQDKEPFHTLRTLMSSPIQSPSSCPSLAITALFAITRDYFVRSWKPYEWNHIVYTVSCVWLLSCNLLLRFLLQSFFVVKLFDWSSMSLNLSLSVSDLFLSPSSEFFILRFLKFIHWERGGKRQHERETSQEDFMLSKESNMELNLMILRSWWELEPRVSCLTYWATQAPP